MTCPALAFALLIGLPGPPPAARSAAVDHASAYTHFLLARHALASDDFALAVDEYTQARDLDPSSAVVRVELAEVYLRLRRYKDAVREAKRAAELDPANRDALEMLAQVHETTGATNEALAVLRRLAELDPGSATYLVRMAAIEDRAGRTEESIRLLEEAVARDVRATEAVFELVERFQGKGRNDRAIETLERAAAADPDNLYLRSKLAELYLQMRDLERARGALEAMVAIAPQNLHVLLEVARAYRQLDDDGRAAELYRTALELGRDDEAIRLQLAGSLMRSGAYRDALREYRQLLTGLGDAPDARRRAERFEFLKRIGLLELELGNVAGAVEALEAARELAPQDDHDFTRLLGRARDLAGNPEGALRLFRERLETASEGPTAIDLRAAEAAFLVRTGRIDEGLERYRALAAEQALDARQLGFLAYALLRAGRPAEGEEALRAAVKTAPAEERAIVVYVASLLLESKEAGLASGLVGKLLDRYPDDRDLFLRAARLYARYDQMDRSVAVLERAVRQFPEDADLRFQLGASFERVKRLGDAERELEEAIRLEPEHATALNYLAYTLADAGLKLDKALGYARRAVALDPVNGAYLDTLGWALYRVGRLEEARTQLLAAVERADDAVIQHHLADVLADLGELTEAAEAYRKALALRPDEDEAAAIRAKLAKLEPRLR